MAVDEYSQNAMRPPRDNFGAGAQENFPSGFEESRWGQAAAGGNLNMGGTTSQADLERAIAASMESSDAVFGGGN